MRKKPVLVAKESRRAAGIAALLVALFTSVVQAAGIIAAAGRVEPVGEERIVIAEVSGRVKTVLINEGDSVKRGQLLAEIENAEQHALAQQAQAQVQIRKAELERMRKGARPEERAAVRAAAREAQAWLQRKQSELLKREQLFTQQLIPEDQRDETRTAVHMAQASFDRLLAQQQQMEAGNRNEDVQIAQAAVQYALAEAARAQANLEKTRIRSPINGTVLKRELREGEMVTTLNPLPLARIGDLSALVVRAEIDELDITKIKPGLNASITSYAFPGQKFDGKVLQISKRMGNKINKTDNPADKEDVRVLEVLIAVIGTKELPVGLRVDVKISTP